ncbi:DNA/RNA non-specific endonuclease [Phenylobacterium sp.]|uniref:DNA/RNA non-specific endonuclease n=1 Tax=Phenylobacterium sp. TaxID=1871053 RepID=UPI00286AE287|nr:DNA/RNA non-specific endonuclease [Phenylobacterium sp.]
MNSELEQIARSRIEAAMPEILNSLQNVAAGNPYAAETDPSRLRTRLQAKSGLTGREAEMVAQNIENASEAPGRARAALERLGPSGLIARPEKVWGDTTDFVNVAFLARGARAARSVGRVAFLNGQAQGSGFLVGEGLFLTNCHVLTDPMAAPRFCLEFDYELDLSGRPRSVTRFAIDTSVFVSDPIDGLDYTLVAVGGRISGDARLEDFGWSALSDASDKHMLGEFANVVQHPQGRFKEVVLRENRLVARVADALHYVADTEPGSSGSPVFNSEWRVIALHHWGGPWIGRVDEAGQELSIEVNEGVRISSVVKSLRGKLAAMPPNMRARVVAALAVGEPESESSTPASGVGGAVRGGARLEADGRVTWTIPLEVSVRLPGLERGGGAPPPPPSPPANGGAAEPPPGPAENAPSKTYSDRGGYKRKFLDGFVVELPKLTSAQQAVAARNKLAGPGDDPFVLKYHHFSVVMNRARKLAFYTACNIDGASAKSVDRDTKTVTPLRPDSAGLESMAQPEGAEATETWYDDPRLDKGDVAGPETYGSQKVPGFPRGNDPRRIARMFQRGHLVRRLDPAWGTDDQALSAEADSFHWTNCSPQVGFFNQGTASSQIAGTGGGKLWRAVENYVLRNAVAEKQRVTSFTGPIFDDAKDRTFRSIKVPGKFFKVTVWVENGALRSIAMIADQTKVIEVWPEALGSEAIGGLNEAEAFQAPGELDKVDDFLTTVTEVERLTNLDFGDAVRDADVRAGEGSEAIRGFEEIDLGSTKSRAKRDKAGRKDRED